MATLQPFAQISPMGVASVLGPPTQVARTIITVVYKVNQGGETVLDKSTFMSVHVLYLLHEAMRVQCNPSRAREINF